MLLSQQADFWNVEDLTAFGDGTCNIAEVLTALAAHLGAVTPHFIWLLHHRERMPRMSHLPCAGYLSYPPAQSGL
jgi:hypothetical protein